MDATTINCGPSTSLRVVIEKWKDIYVTRYLSSIIAMLHKKEHAFNVIFFNFSPRNFFQSSNCQATQIKLPDTCICHGFVFHVIFFKDVERFLSTLRLPGLRLGDWGNRAGGVSTCVLCLWSVKPAQYTWMYNNLLHWPCNGAAISQHMF